MLIPLFVTEDATYSPPEPPCPDYPSVPTVGKVLEILFCKVGLHADDYDLSAVMDYTPSGWIGYVVNQRAPARDALEPVLNAFGIALTEVDGKLKAVILDQGTQGSIPAGDLGARIWQGGDSGDEEGPHEGLVQVRRMQDLDLPARIDFTYSSITSDYLPATQGAVRPTKHHVQEALTVNTSLVLNEDRARRIAEMLLYRQWIEREQFSGAYLPKHMKYAAADVVTLPVGANTFDVRLASVDIGLFGPIAFTAVLHEPSILTQEVVGGGVPLAPVTNPATGSTVHAWNGPALKDAHADSIGLYVAANAATTGDWSGVSLYWSRDGGASYQLLDEIADPSPYGKCDTALPAGTTTGYWDLTNTLDVTMTLGTLESASEAEVLNGANTCLVGSEYVQFVTATLLSEGKYRLSKLLRGRRGSDAFWGSHAAGERFVRLHDVYTKRYEMPDDLVGKAILLKPVSAGGTLAGTTAQSVTIHGYERYPYTVWQITGKRQANNDWLVSWARRTRIGGEWRDLADVPLSEAQETYETEILDAGNSNAVRHTFAGLTSPTFTYTEAQQISDWGAAQTTLRVRVFMIGLYGRGFGQTVNFSATASGPLP